MLLKYCIYLLEQVLAIKQEFVSKLNLMVKIQPDF